MQVEYTFGRPNLQLLIDAERGSAEFEREEAERRAQDIETRGGYARVRFGGDIVSEFGEDPRAR